MRTMRWLLATTLGVLMAVGIVVPPAHASTQRDFISSLVKAAQENQRDTGIPASVAIGMAALETGWGRSSMAKDPINTLFNIKCTAKQSPYQKGCTEVASYEYTSDGKRYLKVSGFRTYANTGDSLKDFGLLLTSLSRYSAAFRYKDDPNAFIREVHRGGYATDPRYTELVTGIMRSYNLYQYDVAGSTTKPTPSPSPQLPVAKDTYTAQSYGKVNTNVTTLQRLLNARFGTRITVNGSYGWTTQAAVADYQYERMRLPEQTGEMDRATWEHLVPTLRPGDKGVLVEALQHELNYSGYSLTVDGVYGSRTRAAVEDFQRRHSLPVTGTTATMTWGKLLGM